MALERLALSRSTLDRAAHLRSDPELFTRLAADPSTLVVALHQGQVPVTDGPDGPVLLLTAAADRPELGAPDVPAFFLGVDVEQRGYVAVSVAQQPVLPEGARWAGLREVGAILDDTGAGIFTTAIALLAWHANHPHCSKCGALSDVTSAGWTRLCPVCGTEHYPRTDPAVIMAITDPDERILLGRQASWPPLRFSTLAGFVEPGESLEDAVRREVAEEAGIVVGEVSYRGSQPWPFPSSLMLGYRGYAVSHEISLDDLELAEARWWSREELADDVKAGRLLLPPGVSIARRLIEEWFGAPIVDSEEPWG
jgi:NAD+ diphosphatase